MNISAAPEFSVAYPAWVTNIKAQAYNQLYKAFVNLPAIVAKRDVSQLYGGDSSKKNFEHTADVLGDWFGAGGRHGQTPYLSCIPQNSDAIPCPKSWVYYLNIMYDAQQASGNLNYDNTGGSSAPVSPTYNLPPLDPSSLAAFGQLTNAIGFAIGAVAAHEIGWELNVPWMGCSYDSCPPGDTSIYQFDAAGSAQEFFYGNDVKDKTQVIHWNHDGLCYLQKL